MLRQEVALAKTEMSEKINRMSHHLIQVAVGGLVAYAGLIVLLFGLGDLVGATMVNAGVDPDVAAWLAPALLGLAVAVTGYVMFASARKSLSADTLVPEQTLQSLQSLQSLRPHKPMAPIQTANLP